MKNKTPEIYVLSPDKRTCFGAVRMLTEFTEDIRFNACSEINFKVAEKICDPLAGKWIKNPVYKNIEKNNLIYICDDTEYFSFPNRTLRNDYGIKNVSNFEQNYGRLASTSPSGLVEMTYENTKDNGSNNGVLTGFELQPETHLQNVSIAQGYNWQNLTDINEYGMRKLSSWSSNYYKVGCLDYIPINFYDVIAIRTMNYKVTTTNINTRFREYTLAFYTDKDVNTYVGDMKIVYGNPSDSNHATIAQPVVRFSIESLKTSDSIAPFRYTVSTDETLAQFKNKLKNGGYFRVVAEDNRSSWAANSINEARSHASYYYTSNGVTYMGWSFPYDGWLQIYSGKRFCSKIDNDITDGSYSLPLHWFVIRDITDEIENGVRCKTVQAYSYEYTISNRSISLSEDTLPFYIPQQIIDTVNGNNWVIDKEYGQTNVRKGKQDISEGLLNQILKKLPDWSIGHISSELMTRYRQISDTDNANIYSFMMNDIESLYQCYFVFDCDNKKISAYTQDDIIGNTNIVLNWQNAINGLKITDQDINFITALRVHTADDTYGVGLVNITGDSTIYNFNSILDKLDFVADNSSNDPLNRNKVTENGITRNRTLKEAVTSLMDFIESPSLTLTLSLCKSVGDGDDPNSIATDYDTAGGHENEYQDKTFIISNVTQYRELAKKFVEANLYLIKCLSSISNYMSEYKSIMDKIAVQAAVKNQSSYHDNEAVRTPFAIYQIWTNNHGSYNPFVTDDLYIELRNISKLYYQAKMEYEAKENDYNAYLGALKEISKRTNLNYYTQLSLTEQYRNNNGNDSDGNPITLSLLTPAEILALQPYIREGDWTNDNSIFNEEYDSNDIISTLVDVYNQAKNDMDLFISKPSYDFESNMINWTLIPEMKSNYKKLKVGKTLYINTIGNEFIIPILLELHMNYNDDSDFSMKFTTDYKRKSFQYRFADLYKTISQVSTTDNTFTFTE